MDRPCGFTQTEPKRSQDQDVRRFPHRLDCVVVAVIRAAERKCSVLWGAEANVLKVRSEVSHPLDVRRALLLQNVNDSLALKRQSGVTEEAGTHPNDQSALLKRDPVSPSCRAVLCPF